MRNFKIFFIIIVCMKVPCGKVWVISSEQVKLTFQVSINPQVLHSELFRTTFCLSGCQLPCPEPSTGRPYKQVICILERADEKLLSFLLASAYCCRFAEPEVFVSALFFLPFLSPCQGGGSELACGWRTKREIRLSQSLLVLVQSLWYLHSNHWFAGFYCLAPTWSLVLEQMLLWRKTGGLWWGVVGRENKVETSVAALSESVTERPLHAIWLPLLEIVALEEVQRIAASTGKGIQ